MSLPSEELALLGATIAGCDLTPPKQALTLTPAPQAMARLQRLHAAAGQLAEDAPEIIAHPEAARGLEQALIGALVDCLSVGEAREDRLAQRHHSLIMRRFRRAVEENPEQPLYIPELCAAIRVSDRTLRLSCQEQLGMSPQRYLLLRRMHFARRALRDGPPWHDNRDRDRRAIWLLAIRTVRRRIQGALRGSAIHHPPAPAVVATDSAFTSSAFLPKVNRPPV
jgi:AraC-like DNA-binding protein